MWYLTDIKICKLRLPFNLYKLDVIFIESIAETISKACLFTLEIKLANYANLAKTPTEKAEMKSNG